MRLAYVSLHLAESVQRAFLTPPWRVCLVLLYYISLTFVNFVLP